MKIKVSANQFITENKKSLSIKDGLKYIVLPNKHTDIVYVP